MNFNQCLNASRVGWWSIINTVRNLPKGYDIRVCIRIKRLSPGWSPTQAAPLDRWAWGTLLEAEVRCVKEEHPGFEKDSPT